MDRLISEKAVLEAFREYQGSISDFYKAVKAIPSAEPKTGHWILKTEDWNKWTCSECGYTERTDIHVSLGYDFCPKCGAKMVEPQEGANEYE